jgi:RNA polymerase sigma factor (TIGR02999 family)
LEQVQNGPSSEVTQLLLRWQGGDAQALEALIPLVYRELIGVARQYLNNERHGHTLQGTALVHEVYVRLIQQEFPQWQNRAHFFAVAAQLMRQILVDYARSRHAAKRGGNICRLSLDEAAEQPQPIDVDIIALDDALKTLFDLDPQQSRVVELKFFAGLSIEDTSQVLGISASTVKRQWITARAWLFRELNESSGG